MSRKHNSYPKTPEVFLPAKIGTLLLAKIGNQWQIGKAAEVIDRDESDETGLQPGLITSMKSKGKIVPISKCKRVIIPDFAAKAVWAALTEGRLSWKWGSPEEFSAYLGENLKL